MATALSQPEQPTNSPGTDEGFRAVVERQVSGPLRESIAQTDLPPSRFVAEALEHEAEIKAEVAAQRRAVEELQGRLRRSRYSLFATISGFAAAVEVAATIALDQAFGLPSWLLYPALSIGVVFGLVPIFLPFLEGRSRRGDTTSSKDGTAPSGASARASQGPLKDQLASAGSAYERALDRAVQGWLADRANVALGEIYLTSLPELDPKGLAEIDDPEQEIPTDVGVGLESLIERMPGGSIGISGPRGAGKTTLLKRVTTDAWHDVEGEISAGVVVDAPVDYDAREFVLHLFARLCEVVLGPERVEAMRGRDQGPGRLARPGPLGFMRGHRFTQFGALLLAVGVIAYVALLDAQGKIHPADLVPVAIGLIAAGATLLYFNLLANIPRLISQVRRRVSTLRNERNRPIATAEDQLRQIWFQRTFSSGWSGALKLPIGVEAGTEKSTQMAENQLSLPDVVAQFKDFVRMLAKDGEVRIGIDELDKMDDERARRFLNEIKVIFRISGCFYLVSVSEDAMAYFERRGLPFRDVFDSSFDDVLRVGYLPYKDSHRMLRRRVVGLPIQFVALCHILGGGLARDVIRACRDLCEHKRGETIADVTAELCTQELSAKCTAARVAVRRLSDPAHVILLSRWLGGISAGAPDTATLLERCESFSEEFVSPLGPAPTNDPERLLEHREALSIALEVITFSYFVATLQEFLPTLSSEAATKAAISNTALDRLAEARQAFAVNPGEAWEAVSAVRTHPLEKGSVDFPALREPAITA